MNAFTRALLCLVIIGCADALTFAPAAFNARYRTPRRITAARVIGAVIAVVLISAVVAP